MDVSLRRVLEERQDMVRKRSKVDRATELFEEIKNALSEQDGSDPTKIPDSIEEKIRETEVIVD